MNKEYLHNSIDLLRELISLKSFSGEEEKRSDFLCRYLSEKGVKTERTGNNIIARQPHHNKVRQTLMLNSHIDTVRPATTYTFDPFNPPLSDTHIFGLGSNDAGASVVCLLQTFLHFYKTELPFNLMLVLSCEEENSGPNGMIRLAKELPHVHFAIIGEPTGMHAAIAERGLLVIDGEAIGVSGHAARNEGVNALYIAMEDILTMKSVKFDKISPAMGEVKLTVTQIHAGTQHNVVPDKCTFVVDIRPTDQYTNPEILQILQSKVKSKLTARNLTNRSSATPPDHPLMKTVEKLGIETYVSPTTSDWMRIPYPAIKMGPGESSRSHQADEFVRINELAEGITGYIRFIKELTTVNPLYRL
ncbi:MAG: M20/M25/M40 family metallo-hydrolase [Petrimonas sp.]|uniref:M20/M25/M40 family metallo-hydrolase n=1 Tax=Petrimonas sp. TaxID=2023866 RepID=UPI002B3F6AF5|nr:M20/M25/M40 family metallo-hydrolase [Petrimonas sp.]